MAKKSIATLRKADSKVWVKVIRTVKNKQTGGYQFSEQVVPADDVDKILGAKK